jgi:hypothetical protein
MANFSTYSRITLPKTAVSGRVKLRISLKSLKCPLKKALD